MAKVTKGTLSARDRQVLYTVEDALRGAVKFQAELIANSAFESSKVVVHADRIERKFRIRISSRIFSQAKEIFARYGLILLQAKKRPAKVVRWRGRFEKLRAARNEYSRY